MRRGMPSLLELLLVLTVSDVAVWLEKRSSFPSPGTSPRRPGLDINTLGRGQLCDDGFQLWHVGRSGHGTKAV